MERIDNMATDTKRQIAVKWNNKILTPQICNKKATEI